MKAIFDEKRISDAEMELLSSTFANKPELLKLIRKFFLFEISPEDPIGKSMDMWTNLDLSEMTPEKMVIAVSARQMLIRHLDGALLHLARIAGETPGTAEEIAKRLQKDSTK